MKKAPLTGSSVVSETTESSPSSTAATQLTHEAKNNQTTTPTATNNKNSIIVTNNSNNPPVIKCTTTITATADKSTKTDESLLMNGMEALNVTGSGLSQTSTSTVAAVVAKSAENGSKTSVIPPTTTNAATMTTSEASTQVTCMSGSSGQQTAVTIVTSGTKSVATASTMTVPVSKTVAPSNASATTSSKTTAAKQLSSTSANATTTKSSTSSSVPINANDVHAFPLPQPAAGSNLNANSISEQSNTEQPVTQNPPVGKLSYAQAAQLLREGNKEAASSNVNEKVPQETTVVPKETKQQKKDGNEAGNRERKGESCHV